MAKHFHQLIVKEIRTETDACVSVCFAVPSELKESFSFIQGQNITLKATVDGEDLRRSYSICSSPLDDELRIAVKKVQDGKFSAWVNDHLKTGDRLEVLPPTGRFYTELNTANQKNYIAFAAGSGITPLLSIIKTTLASEPASHFTLFYGNQNRASIIFREALEGMKNTYMDRFAVHHILSRETTESALYQGRITEDKCVLIFKYLANLRDCDEFFLCGPAAMINEVKIFLETAGVAESKIHFELFTTPENKISTETKTSVTAGEAGVEQQAVVTIQSDGSSFTLNLAYDGASILDAALAAGADLPFACKGGVCATCRAKLLAGEVHMDNNYALEDDEINKGYVLSCQSHPRSPLVSLNFDDK